MTAGEDDADRAAMSSQPQSPAFTDRSGTKCSEPRDDRENNAQRNHWVRVSS